MNKEFMKKWLLLLSLCMCLPAFANTENQQCEFLVEGGNKIDDIAIGFADGVVFLDGCEEGLFVFSDTTEKQNKIGFVDKFGNTIIEPNPEIFFARPFHQSISIVASRDKKFGLINTKGEWVLEPTYDGIYDFRKGMAIAININNHKFSHALIDTTGRELIPMQAGTIREFSNQDSLGRYIHEIYHGDNLYMALYNKDGTIIIPSDHQTIDIDDNGIIQICHHQKGCIYTDIELKPITKNQLQ